MEGNIQKKEKEITYMEGNIQKKEKIYVYGRIYERKRRRNIYYLNI